MESRRADLQPPRHAHGRRPHPADVARHRPGGQAGQRALHHDGEHVVGAGGDRQQRHVAAALGDDPVGAVAAQGDDAAGARVGHQAGGQRESAWVLVTGMSSICIREAHASLFVAARAARTSRACPAPAQSPAHPGHAARAGRCYLLVVVEDRPMGDRPPDIFAGRGIGDDTDDGVHSRNLSPAQLNEPGTYSKPCWRHADTILHAAIPGRERQD